MAKWILASLLPAWLLSSLNRLEERVNRLCEQHTHHGCQPVSQCQQTAHVDWLNCLFNNIILGVIRLNVPQSYVCLAGYVSHVTITQVRVTYIQKQDNWSSTQWSRTSMAIFRSTPASRYNKEVLYVLLPIRLSPQKVFPIWTKFGL